MLTLIDLMTRKRKPVAYRLDELVIEVLAKLAKKENSSINRYIEKHFFQIGIDEGLISENEELIGETRGGDRTGKGNKND